MTLTTDQKIAIMLSPIFLGIFVYIINAVIDIVDNWRLFGIALLVIAFLQICLSVFIRSMYKLLLKDFSVITTMALLYIFSVTIFFLFITILTHIF